jgi:hypothetical protein
MTWYASIVRDVSALQPAAAATLEWTFASIAREEHHNPNSDRWHRVVTTIAGVLDLAPMQRSSRPYRRLEAFVAENRDLLDRPVSMARTA